MVVVAVLLAQPSLPCPYQVGEKVIATHGHFFCEAIRWKNSWDEWVGVDRLKKFTKENLQQFTGTAGPGSLSPMESGNPSENPRSWKKLLLRRATVEALLRAAEARRQSEAVEEAAAAAEMAAAEEADASSQVDWLSYGHDFDPNTIRRTLYRGTIRYRGVIEPYMPDRCLRQLGRMQTVPILIIAPEFASRPSKGKYIVKSSAVHCESGWFSFPIGNCVNIEMFDKGSEPSACAINYMSWYKRHSHPYLLNDGGSSARPIPNRTATEQWMNRWMNATRPFMQHRDEYEWDDVKDACRNVQQLIEDWNKVLHNTN
ncbi:uncharacterized protein LOC104902395 isoform X2 [Beta vulgaris subsp. vulgaris]|uniref:uncharacterized protein LOC104902395 isoform X2 n=1 Tax=Beta vulgaris subsp. vulgaris TaxID=3555 RepID=UPI002036DC0B|nr:uncharacterized protein LOC104902395 isoform X2 [Beta vulgaris subsp. vulgaris]